MTLGQFLLRVVLPRRPQPLLPRWKLFDPEGDQMTTTPPVLNLMTPGVCARCGHDTFVPKGQAASTTALSEGEIIERCAGQWQPIETAPHACHVLATRFDADAGEWAMDVVLSPPSRPFTHWIPLPAPPERGDHLNSESVK